MNQRPQVGLFLLAIDLEDLRRRAGEIASRLVRGVADRPIQSY